MKITTYNSLEKRRVRGDLIQVFRIVKGFDAMNIEDFFELDNGGGHALKPEGPQVEVESEEMQTAIKEVFFSVTE